jgi:hypothetical protein
MVTPPTVGRAGTRCLSMQLGVPYLQSAIAGSTLAAKRTLEAVRASVATTATRVKLREVQIDMFVS